MIMKIVHACLIIMIIQSCANNKFDKDDNSASNEITLNHQFDISDSSKCSKLDWINSGPRSQGGGWIWFSGKGIGKSLYESYKNAEFIAIDRLNKECKYPHINVRFVERCDEGWGQGYISFVRASVKQDECNLTKSVKSSQSNIVNQKVYQDYISIFLRINKKNESCSKENPKDCVDIADRFYIDGKLDEAFENYLTGCNADVGHACFLASSIKLKTGDSEFSNKLLEKGCISEDMNSCFLLAKAKSDQSKISELCDKGFVKACNHNLVSKKILNKANEIGYLFNRDLEILKGLCSKGEDISCAWLTTFTGVFSSSESDRDTLQNLCLKGMPFACYKLGEKFYVYEEYPKNYYSKDIFVKFLNVLSKYGDSKKSTRLIESKYNLKELLNLAKKCMNKDNLACTTLSYSAYTSKDVVEYLNHNMTKQLMKYLHSDIKNYFYKYCAKKEILCNQYLAAFLWTDLESEVSRYDDLAKELCDKNVAGGCNAYAISLEKKNSKKEDIYEFYKKACYLGSPLSCQEMASYELKRGNEIDSQIFTIYGCQNFNNKNASCHELSNLINDLKRPSDKYALMNYGCIERKSETVCNLLALDYLKKGLIDKAKKIMGEMCERNSELSCRHLAQIYFYEDKFNSSLEILKSACFDFDKPDSCFEYGNLNAFLGNKISSEITLRERCEKGSSAICGAYKAVSIGKVPSSREQIFQQPLDFGDGTSFADFSWSKVPSDWFHEASELERKGDIYEANRLYEKACFSYEYEKFEDERRWIAASCAALGDYVKEKKGENKAIPLYKRACDIEDDQSYRWCRELREN
ncbi:MAG: hypothetical protein OHK0056_32950 [Bacteriovoracaceae bacterium]